MLVDVATLHYVQLRAMKRVYRKYGINKLELNFLTCLYGYQRYENRFAVSVHLLLGNMTGNPKNKARFRKHLWACEQKKLVGSYEYIKKPGSYCVGVSEYGLEVISYYYQAIGALSANFRHAEKIDLFLGRDQYRYRTAA